MKSEFCRCCGSRLVSNFIEGDTQPRLNCRQCGHIEYCNPKLVACCIPQFQGKVLLCRRAISPGKGLWTIPGGYLESGETLEACAKREAREEVLADIRIDGVVGMFDVLGADQVHIVFAGQLTEPHFGVGHETTEVKLFCWQDIPWREIAFDSVEQALRLLNERIRLQSLERLPAVGQSKRPPRVCSVNSAKPNIECAL